MGPQNNTAMVRMASVLAEKPIKEPEKIHGALLEEKLGDPEVTLPQLGWSWYPGDPLLRSLVDKQSLSTVKQNAA